MKQERPRLTALPNAEKRVDNKMPNKVFLISFEVFGNVVLKHCLECSRYIFTVQAKAKANGDLLKVVKIYANFDQISKQSHGHDFLCLNLMSI